MHLRARGLGDARQGAAAAAARQGGDEDQERAIRLRGVYISAPNASRIQDVAERCYSEAIHEATKTPFNSIFNFALLATCLVHLSQYQVAVDAARKANSTRTWKEVNASCVEHKKFRLPQICALHIIVTPDKLVELTGSYERSGHLRRSSPPWRRVLASSARTKASSPSRASSKQNVAAQHPQDAQGKCAPVGAHLPRPSKTLASR